MERMQQEDGLPSRGWLYGWRAGPELSHQRLSAL